MKLSFHRLPPHRPALPRCASMLCFAGDQGFGLFKFLKLIGVIRPVAVGLEILG